MNERLFSTGDILEITGLTRSTFDDWIARGIINPVSGGNGTGNHRRFTTTQAVALKLAADLRNNGEAGWATLRKVVERIGGFTEAGLVGQFTKGRTHILSIGEFPMVKPQHEDPLRDVEECYRVVMVRVNEIESRLRRVSGRPRGLAGIGAA